MEKVIKLIEKWDEFVYELEKPFLGWILVQGGTLLFQGIMGALGLMVFLFLFIWFFSLFGALFIHDAFWGSGSTPAWIGWVMVAFNTLAIFVGISIAHEEWNNTKWRRR